MAPTIAHVGGQALPRAVVTILPLGAIVGIAIGGAFLLFSLLIAVSFVLITRKHRREKGESEANEDGFVDMDLKTTMRSTRPPEICLSRRMSSNSFLPFDDGISAHDWADHRALQNPPMTKAKRLSQKFRFSRLRDSWPLSNVPLALLPSQSAMMQSQAAVPGYVVPDSKQPKRSSSVLSTTRSISVPQDDTRGDSSSPTKSHLPTSDLYAPSVTPQRPNHQRRSTSESQLSTILRSTSQRLKAAHRHSLTRTLSTLGRFPGLPPTERLPTPPGKRPTESREGLVAGDYTESIGSSIYNSYPQQTPSPDTKTQRKSNQNLARQEKSPNPSQESDDSLCGMDTPDLVIPAPLTSPSRHGPRGETRHRMRISSAGLKDISSMIHKDSRASTIAAGNADLVLPKNVFSSPPQRISLAGDPFYSMVKSSKPGIPNIQIQGPRAQYVRKATFGHEATTERPESFCSPLQDVSGNLQGPQKQEAPQSSNTHSQNTETNPFQWSPQEAMQTRTTQASPKRSGSRRRGHKRSNVVRMSNLPRPASTVEVVFEEPEEESPLTFRLSYNPPTRLLEPMKSPSPSPSITSSNRRLSVRPPSTAIFNPTFTVREYVGRSEDNSPTLGDEQGIYSPTLSVCNYYSETRSVSEDEFFRSKQTAISASVLKSRRRARNYSVDISRHSKELEQLISFPPPKLSGSEIPILEPPSYGGLPRPLPNIMSTMTPAPPLLTMPIPTHLTGPRAEPKREPPRPNSLEASIGMLRRMNSEVSNYSTISSATSNDESPHSPTLPSYRSSLLSGERGSFGADNVEERQRGRSRGSKYYLSVGTTPPKCEKASARSRQRQGNGIEKSKRDSARLFRERRKRKNEEMEAAEREDELTPVKEMSSPPSTGGECGGVSLRFPTLSSTGTNGVTPPRATPPQAQRKRSKTIEKELDLEMEKENAPHPNEVKERWSDAMTKPISNMVRRESKLEHPVPQRETPPKWGWGLGEDGKVRIPGLGLVGQENGVVVSGLGLAGVRLMGGSSVTEGESVSRPNSLGLYDQEGFLRSSPEREIVEKEMEKERVRREKRAMGRLSGYVM